jgi:hypothetical protein
MVFRVSLSTSPRSSLSHANAVLPLRKTQLQALRDLYLVHKQIELEAYTRSRYDEADAQQPNNADRHTLPPPQQQQQQQHRDRRGLFYGARFLQLFRYNRLRSALLACCTVMLAQQLCGSM